MAKPKPSINPVEYTFGSAGESATADSIPAPEPVSTATYHIAGLLVTVYGLEELSDTTTDVAVLWLLHPRLQTQACMAPFAAHLIRGYHQQTSPSEARTNTSSAEKTSEARPPQKGLIAVSFDQRNHGTREVNGLANEAWRGGNDRHALDMFSCYAGSAVDTSLLLDYLEGYVFPDGRQKIVQNIVLGISLGGHAAWHCLMQDPRVSAAVVVIGCPDYARLMSDRARLSKRKSWLTTQGRDFFGSPDFPPALVAAVRKADPAGLIFSTLNRRPGQEHLYDQIGDQEKKQLSPLMSRCFGNKRLLHLSGGADKLVNYRHSKPFLDWLKKSTGKDGWFHGGSFHLQDIVYPGVGHEVTPPMVEDMVRFTIETLETEQQITQGKLQSKI